MSLPGRGGSRAVVGVRCLLQLWRSFGRARLGGLRLGGAVSVGCLATTGASAAPFLAIGDGAELFLTTSGVVRYEDNVFFVNQATADTVFEATPGTELVFGKNSELKGSVALSERITRYADTAGIATQLFSGSAAAAYDGAKAKWNVRVGFTQENQNTVDNPRLIRRDIGQGAVGGEWAASELWKVAAGASALHRNYWRAGFGDAEDVSVPLDVWYAVSAKSELGFGYRYRDYRTTVGPDSRDHFFSVAARGEFTPKLTGEVRAGHLVRTIAGGQRVGLPGLELRLSWAVSPKTNVALSAANAPDTNPFGLQQRNFSAGANASVALREEWRVSAGCNVRATRYATRTDTFVDASVGVAYTFSSVWSFSGDLARRENISILRPASILAHVVAIGGRMRY